MNEQIERQKQQLQELIVRVPASGSYESVSLTERISELRKEIAEAERRERETQLVGAK